VGDWLPSPRIVRHASTGKDICLVGNLECAIAGAPADPLEKAYHVVVPESAREWIVRSPFRALNLANNHSADAGTKALKRLARRLVDESTIQPYGLAFLPYALLQVGQHRCAVIGCAAVDGKAAQGLRFRRMERPEAIHIDHTHHSERSRF
jgi:hypothetical protein